MKINVDLIYPIGSIYQSTSTVSPAVLFGGTWQRIANGRTLVGIDTSDTDFNAVRKTGGSKYLQAHTHKINAQRRYSGDATDYGMTSIYASSNILGQDFVCKYDSYGVNNLTTGNSGNLQPYYCVYIWERIS